MLTGRVIVEKAVFTYKSLDGSLCKFRGSVFKVLHWYNSVVFKTDWINESLKGLAF